LINRIISLMVANMDFSEKYIEKKGDVIGKEIQSKSVLLNLDNGRYYTLNKTGTFIWSLLDKKKDLNYIIERITKQFDIEKDRASLDVQTFIEALGNERLIIIKDETT